MGVGLQHVRSYSGFQNNESQVVALDLLRTPENYVMHFERYAASVVSIIGFGRRISSPEDPIITEVIAVMQRAAELNVPGTTFPMLLETFPFLARFPNWMAPWKHELGGNKGRGRNFYYALAEEAVKKGNHETCYAKKIWDEAPKYGLTNSEIASLTGNLFGAGSDTSSSTLITFVLACCAFPEVLPAAWEELDRVVGPYRSPSLDDDLPYIRALVKEVFRWRSVAIIGGQPHAPIEDDNYKVSIFARRLLHSLTLSRGISSPKEPGSKAMSGPSITHPRNSLNRIVSILLASSPTTLSIAPSPTIKGT